MKEQTSLCSFEINVLPHLSAAYNLACWLMRNNQDAEDMVQEAYLRAFRFFGDFRGGDVRSWVLKIVRNTCYTQLHRNRPEKLIEAFDEEIHSGEDTTLSPEALLLKTADRQCLRQAIEELPVRFRELLMLRELEGLSYGEIADVVNIPIGSVMSGLSRARARLRKALSCRSNSPHERPRPLIPACTP